MIDNLILTQCISQRTLKTISADYLCVQIQSAVVAKWRILVAQILQK